MASSGNVIRKNIYDKISTIVEKIDAEVSNDVINNPDYKRIRNQMNNFEKKNQHLIIDGIIKGYDIDKITTTINKSIKDTTNAIDKIVGGNKKKDDESEIIDDIEKRAFMISEQKVVESSEPVNIVIGNEDTELEEAMTPPVEVIIGDIINNVDNVVEFNAEHDYGEEYKKVIRELTQKEFESANKPAFDDTGWGTKEFLTMVSNRIYDYEVTHGFKKPELKVESNPEQKPQLRSIWAEALGSLPCFTVK